MLDDEPSPISKWLDRHAGHRERVVDEFMYQLPPGAGGRAAFRLQLFTARHQRPVAVATQQMSDCQRGASLINAAEACASSVWQQYFPNEAEPPIWVQRFLPESGSPRIAAVSFTVDTRQRRLGSPVWRPLRDEDVETLVGQCFDRGRGTGFVPPQPDPEEMPPRYASAWVALFPTPVPFRQPACMSVGTPWWRRLGRQIAPSHRARPCCWYHGGDWQKVSTLAIRLVRQAQARAIPHDEIPHDVDQQAQAIPLSIWEREALESLLIDTIRPYRPFQGGYNNGQHRAQAMLDAGVRLTLVERY
ncbi:hypothetical protein [Micromonospora profundi]|uniref:hypothetical protein n=1 Tax=Micromonospora profundi TaxID=1420889 RepID=UPI0036933EFF